MDVEQEISDAEARAQSLAFNAEAARAGFMAAGLDMMKMMQKNGVVEGEAAILTGAIEFTVQLWEKTMEAAGYPPQIRRAALEKQVRLFIQKVRNS